RVGRARRLRHGRPERARRGRDRPRGVAGLRVRLRARAAGHDPLRDRRDPHLRRQRRPLPRAVLMRAPLPWIREFTPPDAGVGAVVGALNRVGLEVEGVEEPGREIVGVRVARVVDVVPHPNADRLTLVDLDVGDGATRVVCGATNVHPGMLAPYAPAGATLPGGVTLERRTLKGEVSDGMLLSPRELGLGDDHAGIMDLDATVEPGTDVREALGLDDVI